MVGRVAYRQGLLPSAIRTHDDVLRLPLDPEMWRVIRQIRYKSDKRCARRSCTNRVKAVGNLAVKVGNYGEHQVRRMLCPVISEQFHTRGVAGADRALAPHPPHPPPPPP